MFPNKKGIGQDKLNTLRDRQHEGENAQNGYRLFNYFMPLTCKSNGILVPELWP